MTTEKDFRNLKVGDKISVYEEPTYRKFEKNFEDCLWEGTVVKVGRKYITVNLGGRVNYEFVFEDLIHDYYLKEKSEFCTMQLFISHSSAIEYSLKIKYLQKIREYFSRYDNFKIPMSDITKILDIIDKVENK